MLKRERVREGGLGNILKERDNEKEEEEEEEEEE